LSASKTSFDILAKLSNLYKGNTELSFSDDSIKAQNKEYVISMPTIQSSDSAFVRSKQFLDGLPKTKTSFNFKISDLLATLTNVMSVYEQGALVLLTKKKGDKVEMTINTSIGTISDQIEVEDSKGDTFKDTFDPRMLLDILNVATKEGKAFFGYIEDKALLIRTDKLKAKTTYVCTVIKK